jgi:Mannosyl-glycoprotein endo-beta-N-acetylglucosaminidase
MLNKHTNKQEFLSKNSRLWSGLVLHWLSRCLRVGKQTLTQLTNNWFTYSLVIIILVAIYKKHKAQHGAEALFQDKAQAESGLFSASSGSIGKQDQEQLKFFLERFGKTAIEEETKFGIPARVILAIAWVQSDQAQSGSLQAKNNYFGMKTNGKLVTYGTAWQSFRAFSKAAMNVTGKKNLQSTDELVSFLAKAEFIEPTDLFEEKVRATLKLMR